MCRRGVPFFAIFQARGGKRVTRAPHLLRSFLRLPEAIQQISCVLEATSGWNAALVDPRLKTYDKETKLKKSRPIIYIDREGGGGRGRLFPTSYAIT